MIARLRPRAWLGLALLSLLGLAFTILNASWAVGKDVVDTCAGLGQPFDRTYRSDNRLEPSRWFPMHNKCNADYDLIPDWINPALVLCTVAVVVCLVGAIAATVRLIRKRR